MSSTITHPLGIENQADFDAIKEFFPELDDITIESESAPPAKKQANPTTNTTKSGSTRRPNSRLGNATATKKQREELPAASEEQPQVTELEELRANTNYDVHRRLDNFVASGGRVEVLQSPQSLLTFLFTLEKNIRFSLCDTCIKLYLTDSKKIQPLQNGYYLLSLALCPQCAYGNSESKRVYKQTFAKQWNGGGQQQQQRHPSYYTTGGGVGGAPTFGSQQHSAFGYTPPPPPPAFPQQQQYRQ
jgi:hypothetical protein